MKALKPQDGWNKLLKTITGKYKFLLLLETAAAGKTIYVREATGVLKRSDILTTESTQKTQKNLETVCPNHNWPQ